MKKSKLTKKLISTFLIFSIIFSLFSGVVVVDAAQVLSIKYERVRENTLSGSTETNRLLIYGNGFENPKIKAGLISEIPIPINPGLSNSDVIVIDDQEALKAIKSIPNKIVIMNNGTENITIPPIDFDLSSIPTITSTSKSKVYINEPLDIDGLFFSGLNANYDEMFISGTRYSLTYDQTTKPADATIDIASNKIKVAKIKSPINTGLSDVTIVRKLSGDARYQIVTTFKNSIKVVDSLKGIDIERVDPNTGPRTKKNLVTIYGKTGFSNFNSSMRVFSNGAEGSNKGTVTNISGQVIGLAVELPTSPIAGAANILLTNSDLSSEFEIPNGFIYLDIGNTLSIDTDGISPSYKKETETKPVTVTGRNIGYFDAANYDKLSGVVLDTGGLIGYTAYNKIPQTNNVTSYKVKYTGFYDVSTPITIMRQINVFIDGEAKLVNGQIPTFTKSKDTIVVNPADVNLDPNQPKSVDVTIKTTTLVFDETSKIIYYSRNEEYTVKNGFMYIPDEITPIITSVTPDFGPNDRDIIMTVKGQSFQVLEDGTLPTVKVGDRLIEGAGKISVYDSQNRVVDGKKIALGTKIKLTLPKATASNLTLSGAVDVVVKNPSKGQYTFINGFEFRNPSRIPNKMPAISSIKEPFADIRGGMLTGETVLVTGINLDTSLEGNHRVVITIDGEKAEIKGKVAADGKTVTIIPPPGTVTGNTKLQLINEDGSMTEDIFEYRRVITSPKITKIVPSSGGQGTKLVIKGEDFMLPDNGVNPDDPRRKGTVVLLGGKELNAYKYTASGSITNGLASPNSGSIYYVQPNVFDGEMVKVIDGTTIYIDIPDSYYSFNSDPAAVAPYHKIDKIPLGDLSVEVLNPDGAKSKEDIKFTYLKPGTKPTITSVTPASGSINGGTIVTILGTNFRQDDLKVYFGSEPAARIDYINTTEIKVQAPTYPYDIPEGKDNLFVPVMVTNYDGSMAVYDKPGFEYRIPGSKPAIISLSPSRGTAAGGEEIVIRGRDFRRNTDNTSIPKVYFNGAEATVTWLGNDNVNEILIVKTPPSKVDGPVDVVLINYDSGSVTYKSFTYEVSSPAINSITPNIMNKQGGTKLQINGTGFKKGDYSSLLNGEKVGRNTTSPTDAYTQIDTLVIFGDVTTGDKKAIDTVIGPYYTELNDIRVDYTSVNSDTVSVKLSKTNDAAHTAIRPVTTIPIGSAHMFIINGKQDLGDDKLGDEGILVEATPNQIIVTRRIAAYTRWENNGLQLTTVTPAVGSINARSMYIKNIDGGMASTTINVMNPASSPTITYVSPRNKAKQAGGQVIDYTKENANDIEYYTYTPVNGGAFITITGTDFRRNVKVYMGSKLLEIVSRSINDDQLVVKVPKGTVDELDKLYRIMVVNEDGGSADSSVLSKPHYIVYKLPQSTPIIEVVTPPNTSARGENTVKIIGNDFREGIKVYIDGVESTSVTWISYKELAVKVPLGLTPGKKLVQAMNPDYGFAEKKDAINIVSSPQIDTVYDIVKNRIISPVLFSIDGGQKIKLMGSDFMQGAKVVVGGTLKAKEDLKEGETGIACYNVNDAAMVIVGGTEATDVKIENSAILTFATPKLKVGSVSVIVLNQDGGVSNAITASYQKPYPDSPSGIMIEVVDSDTIKLEWDKILGTNHYELYAAFGPNSPAYTNYLYVGSVEAYEVSPGRLRYYVDGLKASSWYSFKLKSVNDYGPSVFSPSTGSVKTKDKKIITFYQIIGDYEGGIAQNDRISMLGSSLVFTAGEKSLGDYGSGLVVYFNQSSYNMYNPKSVDISLQILKKYPNNSITINEKDFTLKMLSNNLLVKEAGTVSNNKLTDSKMSVTVNKELKAKGDEIRLKLPRGYKAVTSPIAINITMQVEQGKTSIKNLSGNARITYNISDEAKKKYPGGIYVAFYNNTTKKLELLRAEAGSKALTAETSKPGEYILIGKLTR